MEKGGKEAQQYVWEGAIPLQIHLHDFEVTTLPPPAPALVLSLCTISLILAPRIGYLPLLSPQLKPFFSGALPPGVDTVWFDYKGLPLKWYSILFMTLRYHHVLKVALKTQQNLPVSFSMFYQYIPTGVLFDLLCAEPERPWNLTVCLNLFFFTSFWLHQLFGAGKYLTLLDAVKSILPEFYPNSLNTIKTELKKEVGIEAEAEGSTGQSNAVEETQKEVWNPNLYQ
ncbi:hypothetical protein OSB04_000494, partial [Centaurea solstitialis]